MLLLIVLCIVVQKENNTWFMTESTVEINASTRTGFKCCCYKWNAFSLSLTPLFPKPPVRLLEQYSAVPVQPNFPQVWEIYGYVTSVTQSIIKTVSQQESKDCMSEKSIVPGRYSDAVISQNYLSILVHFAS